MDNEQAKLILATYRPDGRDADEPSMAEALRQADRDPELRRWFAGQKRFDHSMVTGLESVRPPAGSKGQALAAIRVTRRQRKRRAWAWPMAMAASIALVTTLTIVMVNRPEQVGLPQSASIEALAGYLAEHHASIGLMNEDYSTLVDWIRNNGGPVPENLPAAMAQVPVIGCQTWNTDHGKVSLVCFVGPDRKNLHLYVFEDVTAMPGSLPQRGDPHIERHGMWAMASWQDGGQGYVLGLPAEGDAATVIAPFIKV